VLNKASPTIWGCPHIVTLEERFVKTKSSMVASTIPKALFVTEIGMLPAPGTTITIEGQESRFRTGFQKARFSAGKKHDFKK
jgi:hypothetical protein